MTLLSGPAAGDRRRAALRTPERRNFRRGRRHELRLLGHSSRTPADAAGRDRRPSHDVADARRSHARHRRRQHAARRSAWHRRRRAAQRAHRRLRLRLVLFAAGSRRVRVSSESRRRRKIAPSTRSWSRATVGESHRRRPARRISWATFRRMRSLEAMPRRRGRRSSCSPQQLGGDPVELARGAHRDRDGKASRGDRSSDRRLRARRGSRSPSSAAAAVPVRSSRTWPRRCGVPYRIARDAEVIAPIGVALALVRDVVERTIHRAVAARDRAHSARGRRSRRRRRRLARPRRGRGRDRHAAQQGTRDRIGRDRAGRIGRGGRLRRARAPRCRRAIDRLCSGGTRTRRADWRALGLSCARTASREGLRRRERLRSARRRRARRGAPRLARPSS